MTVPLPRSGVTPLREREGAPAPDVPAPDVPAPDVPAPDPPGLADEPTRYLAAILIGAVAGLMPALRAARISPTEALWTFEVGSGPALATATVVPGRQRRLWAGGRAGPQRRPY